MSYNIEIEVDIPPEEIFEQLDRTMEDIKNHVKREATNFMDTRGMEAVTRYFPRGGSGAVMNSLAVFEEEEPDHFRFWIATTEPRYEELIKFLEVGTVAHTIRPENAVALRFQPELLRFYSGVAAGERKVRPLKILGDFVFALSVKHPGTAAYRMFETGMNDVEPELREDVKNWVKEIVG